MNHLTIILFFGLATLSCETSKQNVSSSVDNSNLIQDCPEELISNQMPSISKSNIANKYYIYKGFRREVKEFDSVWVSKHCKVKVTVAQ